jgi:hypothetical protein
MSSVFEQPWLLLGVAVLVLLGVMTVRSVWPEKQKVWQWLLPLGVAALAFGVDALVTTDPEGIHHTVNAARRAIVAENAAGVAACIAPAYNDGYHKSREELVTHLRRQLTGPTVASIRKISEDLQISGTRADMMLFVSLKLEEQSQIAQRYGVLGCVLRAHLRLAKQPDQRWLISSIDQLSVDQMPVSWGNAE